MEYEIKKGRKPEDFSHKKVGYDIHSNNTKEERFIEVKGVSESWNTYTWQSLHHTQIDCLKKYPNKFWLYIIRFCIDKENRNLFELQRTLPEAYMIPGGDLLDTTKFRIEEESYSLKSALGTTLKVRLQEEKYKNG